MTSKLRPIILFGTLLVKPVSWILKIYTGYGCCTLCIRFRRNLYIFFRKWRCFDEIPVYEISISFTFSLVHCFGFLCGIFWVYRASFTLEIADLKTHLRLAKPNRSERDGTKRCIVFIVFRAMDHERGKCFFFNPWLINI